eukprot:15459265-Alexandrium_andersonii.AAC.1
MGKQGQLFAGLLQQQAANQPAGGQADAAAVAPAVEQEDWRGWAVVSQAFLASSGPGAQGTMAKAEGDAD